MWTFNFDNFSEFQNVISNTFLTRERHYDALSTNLTCGESNLYQNIVLSHYIISMMVAIFAKSFTLNIWQRLCRVCYEIHRVDVSF